MCGAAIEVPFQPLSYVLVGTEERMLTPGATTLGFGVTGVILEGPRLEKEAMEPPCETAPVLVTMS